MDNTPDFQEHHADWLFHRLFLRYYRRPTDEAKRTARRWMLRAIEYYGWEDRKCFIQILDKR